MYILVSSCVVSASWDLVLVRRNVAGDVPVNWRGICGSLLVIPDGASSVRAAAGGRGINRHIVVVLGTAEYMHVVPDLAQHSPARIVRTAIPAGGRLVISRARAAKIRYSSVLGRESVLNIDEVVLCAVARRDTVLLQPLEGWELLVVSNRCLEEINHLFMLLIIWSVARDIEGGIAGCVLAEFVAPEVGVGSRS